MCAIRSLSGVASCNAGTERFLRLDSCISMSRAAINREPHDLSQTGFIACTGRGDQAFELLLCGQPFELCAERLQDIYGFRRVVFSMSLRLPSRSISSMPTSM
jgi:hypothetical protein